MAPVWPRLARMNLNTVLVGVSWALTEPAEGRYDFSLVDQALASARASHLHVILIWFGSWKNGISSFAPDWVKADQRRFPRVQIRGGKSIEVLSTLSDANRDADQRAYAAFMRHLRAVDGALHTTLMIQLENELGILGDSRDRSPAAEAAYAGPVPAELMDAIGRTSTCGSASTRSGRRLAPKRPGPGRKSLARRGRWWTENRPP